MSALPESGDLRHEDLIELIAEQLPPAIRAAYYREMLHCRSLPENDEMLRIIHIIQILTFLIHQAPATVITERGRIEALCASLISILEKTLESVQEYQAHLDERLGQLPEDIAKRIQPEVIAAAISESVRQEFARTGLLQIGQGFQATSGNLEKMLARFNATIDGFEADRNDVIGEIRDGSRTLVQAMCQTSESLIREGQRISRKTRWQRDALACIVIIAVFVFGMWYDQWLHAAPAPVKQTIAPVTQQAPPPEQPKQPRKPR